MHSCSACRPDALHWPLLKRQSDVFARRVSQRRRGPPPTSRLWETRGMKQTLTSSTCGTTKNRRHCVLNLDLDLLGCCLLDLCQCEVVSSAGIDASALIESCLSLLTRQRLALAERNSVPALSRRQPPQQSSRSRPTAPLSRCVEPPKAEPHLYARRL